MTEKSSAASLTRIEWVIGKLLDPESGCPWDLKQTPMSVRMYVLEETYEMIGALESGNTEELREELGDCFFMLCFLVKLLAAQGLFDLDSVLDEAAQKMIYRHPHVFGQAKALNDSEEVKAQWHQLKQKEKRKSLLGGVPQNLPSLLRTHRLTQRAGQVGFDWEGPEKVLETLEEEIAELKLALKSGRKEQTSHELGDVLFTLANLARHLKLSAEETLRAANDRFNRRFNFIEEQLNAKGKSLDETGLEEMDLLWVQAKAQGL